MEKTYKGIKLINVKDIFATLLKITYGNEINSWRVRVEDIVEVSNDRIILLHWTVKTKPTDAIKEKKSIQLEKGLYTFLRTDSYDEVKNQWIFKLVSIMPTNEIMFKTPVEFDFTSYNFGLIESKEELNQYWNSSLDFLTWNRVKVLNKMKELGFGPNFSFYFCDLIGNDIGKYYCLIDLAKEVKDINLLMYLFVKKFGD